MPNKDLTCTVTVPELCGKPSETIILVRQPGEVWRAYPRCISHHALRWYGIIKAGEAGAELVMLLAGDTILAEAEQAAELRAALAAPDQAAATDG